MDKNYKNPTVFSDAPVIREAIQAIAWKGVVDPKTMAPYSSRKITGYVAKIHTDGELAGTVDVQEYKSYARASRGVREGYHEGVYLSALQDNNGMLIVPMLYSEVVIMQDPESKKEYVVMFSHVDIINLDSHQSITVGVQEREEFDVNSDVELEDLEPTGVFSKTIYEKNRIVTEVVGKKDTPPIKETLDVTDSDNPSMLTEVGGSDSKTPIYTLKIGENQTVTITGGDQAQIEIKSGDNGSVLIKEKETIITNKDTVVKLDTSTPGQEVVYLGSDSSTDVAVLGNELADVLLDLLGALGQMMTTTMMGPQPPLNLASYINLQVKVQTYKAMTSGFLTKHVKIQK